jgi:hypothetical protein
MSENWIRTNEALFDSPKIAGMVDFLYEDNEAINALVPGAGKTTYPGGTRAHERNAYRNAVTALVTVALQRVWAAANVYTGNGVWHGVTPAYFDALAQIPDFGYAMVAVGWLKHDEESSTCIFPNFLEYNVPAKDERRAPRNANAERMRRYRARKAAAASPQMPEMSVDDVTQGVTRSVTSDVTRDVTRHNTLRNASHNDVALQIQLQENKQKVISNVVGKPACESEITCEERADNSTSNPPPNSAADDLDNLAAKIHTFPRPSYPAPDCGQVIGMLRQYGINTNAYNEGTRKLATLGINADELQAAIFRVRDNKGDTFKIAPAYLATVIEAMRAEPAEKPKPKTANAWWASFPAMEAKARELGISGARPGEETDQFKARIQTAIDSHNLKVN